MDTAIPQELKQTNRAFAVSTDQISDADDDYGDMMVVGPWSGRIKENGTVLLMCNGAGELVVRRVVSIESGRLVLMKPYCEKEALEEKELSILGAVIHHGRYV